MSTIPVKFVHNDYVIVKPYHLVILQLPRIIMCLAYRPPRTAWPDRMRNGQKFVCICDFDCLHFLLSPLTSMTMPSPRPSRKTTGRTPRDDGSPQGSRKPAEVLPLFAADRAAAGVDDRIHATIHEAVLDHRLPPGTRLGEVALA